MREKEAATRVIFVRHGQTDFPIDRIYCDDIEDPSLSEAGQEQARQIAEFLSGFDVRRIYASPFTRTMMTAEAIAGFHKLEVEKVDALRERRFGIWEGLYFHDIEKRFPDEYGAWKRDQAGFCPDGGESIYDMRDRAQPELKRIIADNIGSTVVVVAHVGPIRGFVAESMGMDLSLFRQIRIDPASATCIDFGKSQNNLLFLNFHMRHGSGRM